MSSTTNTGFARARELFGQQHEVVRYPFDLSWSVGRFLDRIRPDALILLELEAWPNMMAACSRRGIPVGVVNGRLSDRGFRRYRRFRRWARGMFEQLAVVGAQTETYAHRFRALGVPADRVSVTDTMKWDTAPLGERARDVQAAGKRLGRLLGLDPDKPLVVAGSTGPGEEAALIAGKPEGVALLVAPRKPERFDEVARLTDAWVRRSSLGPGSPGPSGARGRELFLLDTLGELGAAYALADVVVVGRSFNGLGGSDPMEPAALGKPLVMGPDHSNFAEVVDALRDAGALRVAEDPWPVVHGLLQDPDARRQMGDHGRELVRTRQGATGRNVALIRSLLSGPPTR